MDDEYVKLIRRMNPPRTGVKVRRAAQGKVGGFEVRPCITVCDCSEKDYTVITMRSRDSNSKLSVSDYYSVISTHMQNSISRHVDGAPNKPQRLSENADFGAWRVYERRTSECADKAAEAKHGPNQSKRCITSDAGNHQPDTRRPSHRPFSCPPPFLLPRFLLTGPLSNLDSSLMTPPLTISILKSLCISRQFNTLDKLLTGKSPENCLHPSLYRSFHCFPRSSVFDEMNHRGVQLNTLVLVYLWRFCGFNGLEKTFG
ncbi:hypothetical protein HAX54_036092, partial [Datura stramonium]|nr:hypothetical protein [Datura stramonium]